jgi:hypothetical protein
VAAKGAAAEPVSLLGMHIASTACRHVAMILLLVQLFSNEVSTSLIPIPWILDPRLIAAGFME